MPAARQHLCPDVSVFDQTDRTPGWYHEFICPSPSTCQTIHQAQLGAPVQDTREVCGRLCFLPFALIRRPPTSDIPIAVCRVAFAHVTRRSQATWKLEARGVVPSNNGDDFSPQAESVGLMEKLERLGGNRHSTRVSSR